MGKSRGKSVKPAGRQRLEPATGSIVSRVTGFFLPVCIVGFTLWQGSYFPIQFLAMIAFLLLAFVLFGKTLVVTKEALMLFGVSLLYCLSLLVYSDSKYTGMIETLRTLVFPLTLLLFLNSDRARAEKSIFAALAIVAVLGLLDYFSVISIPGGVDESQGRLHSVIQYANTTALFMLVGVLYSIDRFIESRKIWSLCFGAVFAAALSLTGSRTTLVIALAVCALYMFIITGRRGKIIVACSVLLAASTVVSLSILTDIRIFRITVFASTLVERWITFQDAFEMLRGRWALGIGAGNWQEWQFRFQSAPYYVKYIHNFYLQLLLDGGVLAPALFCAATFPAVYKGVRSKSVHGAVLIAFLLHALLDFALIFTAAAMIAMFSLSQLMPGAVKQASDASKRAKEKPPERNRRVLLASGSFPASLTLRAGKLRYAAIVPLLAMALLWGSEFFSSAASAEIERGALDSAMRMNKTALVLNPLNTGLYYRMAQSTLDTDLAEEYLRLAIEKNPNDLRAVSLLAQSESRKGNYEQALELSAFLVGNRKHLEFYRALYRDAAYNAFEQGIIDAAEYEAVLAEIDAITLQINPLYVQYHQSEINDTNSEINE